MSMESLSQNRNANLIYFGISEKGQGGRLKDDIAWNQSTWRSN